MNRTFQQQILGLVGWLVITFAAAGLGGFASASAPTFYAALVRPAWAPPAWLFGPVWSVLYLLMGIAAWLVWRQAGWARAKFALCLYLLQLALNALWTWLFFVWHLGAMASFEIVLLWLLIAATMYQFSRIHKLSAWLLAPYLVWVSFATALSFAMWQLNPRSL
jgi:tryptophan-rich sensory protein